MKARKEPQRQGKPAFMAPTPREEIPPARVRRIYKPTKGRGRLPPGARSIDPNASIFEQVRAWK